MSHRLLIAPQAALDETWYRRLTSITKYTPEIYVYLGPSSSRLQASLAKFIDSNDAAIINLRPDDSFAVAVASEKRALQAMLADLERHENDTIIRQVYVDKLTELILQADLYEAARTGHTADFRRTNQQIYGQLDHALYSAVCATFRKWAAESSDSGRQSRQYSRQLLELIPDFKADLSCLYPKPKVFKHQRFLHTGPGGFYESLFSPEDIPAGMIHETSGDKIVSSILAGLDDSYSLVDSSDSYWGLRQNPKSLVRPTRYNLSSEEFTGLIGHEIGSHLLERLNGERQPLRLLGSGLKGYEKGNEGRALIREQVAYPTWQEFAGSWRWYEILRRYFVIGYACGTGNHDTKTFPQVFKALHALDMFWHLSHGAQDSPMTSAAVRLQTWELVTRILKGTDGTGGAYLKDKVYLEGNLACWSLAGREPDSIATGDLGKFDITDSSQRTMLLPLLTTL